jgi:hypothetical protein
MTCSTASSSLAFEFSHQHCEPWARPQESFCLSVPPDRVIGMSPQRKSLLGCSIHPLFIGQVATRHPLKRLEANYRNSLGTDDEAIARGEELEPDL